MARLSGRAGLKLSIRRLASYTRQPARCLPYRRRYRGGGELSSSSLSNYLSIATTTSRSLIGAYPSTWSRGRDEPAANQVDVSAAGDGDDGGVLQDQHDRLEASRVLVGSAGAVLTISCGHGSVRSRHDATDGL